MKIEKSNRNSEYVFLQQFQATSGNEPRPSASATPRVALPARALMTSSLPRVPLSLSARLAIPLLSALRAQGTDVDAFLARLGLDATSLAGMQQRLTMEAF